MDILFCYDLEGKKVVEGGNAPRYGVTYYKTTEGVMVEVGDGYRHNINLDSKYWNRLLLIIRNQELDEAGINVIVRGLMRPGLHEEFAENFIDAVNKDIIRPINI